MAVRGDAGYDVIGDVHGEFDKLTDLLGRMGYRHRRGAYRHPERTAVFVGDLIDRNEPGQLPVIDLVRSMVDAESALMVLGNHEFNAVAYATERPDGSGYCRQHNAKHSDQHASFLNATSFGSPLHREIISWFCEIPLWLDLGGLRVVHACWSSDDMDVLVPHLGEGLTLTDEVVMAGSSKGSAIYEAIERVLKGPEIHMGGVTYLDKGGHERSSARARWWNPAVTTLRDAAVVPGGCELVSSDGSRLDVLPATPLRPGVVPLYRDEIPVVVGHYWFTGSFRVQSPYVACVDYSAAGGGPLVAYRWNPGDSEMSAASMI